MPRRGVRCENLSIWALPGISYVFFFPCWLHGKIVNPEILKKKSLSSVRMYVSDFFYYFCSCVLLRTKRLFSCTVQWAASREVPAGQVSVLGTNVGRRSRGRPWPELETSYLCLFQKIHKKKYLILCITGLGQSLLWYLDREVTHSHKLLLVVNCRCFGLLSGAFSN